MLTFGRTFLLSGVARSLKASSLQGSAEQIMKIAQTNLRPMSSRDALIFFIALPLTASLGGGGEDCQGASS